MNTINKNSDNYMKMVTKFKEWIKSMNFKCKFIAHTHDYGSQFDSASSPAEMAQAAKDMGYDAISETNHGTMGTTDDFYAACTAIGIKPVVGTEGYVQEDETFDGRAHIVMYAKDWLGYQAISTLTTMANQRIDSAGFPRMNREMIENVLGKDSKYYGHVYVTSACMGGIIGNILMRSINEQEKIEKFQREQSQYIAPDNKGYLHKKEQLETIQTEIDLKTSERKDAQAFVKAHNAWVKKEKTVAKLLGTDEYESALANLNAEKEETKAMKQKVEDLAVEIATLNAKKKDVKTRFDELDKSVAKYMAVQEKINKCAAGISSPESLVAEATETAKWYAGVIGRDNFFIELQYHGFMRGQIPLEEIIMTTTLNIAKAENLELIYGSDAHMANGSEQCIRARQLVKTLRFAPSLSSRPATVEPGDDQLYIKPLEEIMADIAMIIDEDSVKNAVTNAMKVGETCDFHYEILEDGSKAKHYPVFGAADPQAELRRIAHENIAKKFPGNKWTAKYEAQLEHELNVICSMGYADYFLIEQDFLGVGRTLGHLTLEDQQTVREKILQFNATVHTENERKDFLTWFNKYINEHATEPGLSVGPGRGSGAGSIVTYLLGITSMIDPIEHSLFFERFLNPERLSMPDIDSDFADEVRDITIEYCKVKYGVESVARIQTCSYRQPKGCIRDAARCIGKEAGFKDSERVTDKQRAMEIKENKKKYFANLADEICKLIPNTIGVKFNDFVDDAKTRRVIDILNEKYQESEDDEPAVASRKRNARAIIADALLLEGTFSTHGIHAAGVLIADGHAISDYVPERKTDIGMVVQCDHDQAEAIHGMIKFDFLGLKNLRVITSCLRSIKKRFGKDIDPLQFDLKDPAVYANIYATGNTVAVFQFESSGITDALMQMKPSCFDDIVGTNALYRPGPMQYIPKYIRNKWNPDSVTYEIPELKPILDSTHGTLIFQEQVQQVFRDLAGYSLGQADLVRRLMAKKKPELLVKEREAFLHGDSSRNIIGCEANGIDVAKANELFDEIMNFASYAFNKAHAAAYSAVSYITAWLKLYYTEDYLAAVLNYSDDVDSYYKVFTNAKEMGIKILPPDVNVSGKEFTAEKGAIRFGMSSVKSTKDSGVDLIIAEREKNGKYTSFVDVLRRTNADKSTVENLIKAGAFDEFSSNRFAMLMAYPKIAEALKKIKDKEVSIEKMGTPTDKRGINALERAKKALDELNNAFSLITINDNQDESTKQRLINEKGALGFFVTGSLMDSYKAPEETGCISIDKITSNSKKGINLMGVVQNLTIRQKDGENMAFFDLEDKSGKIHVCAFRKTYKEYGHLIEENEVLKISGNVNVEIDDTTGAETLSIFMQKCFVIQPDKPMIIIPLPNGMFDEIGVTNELYANHMIETSGHPLVFRDEREEVLRSTKLYVSEKILETEKYGAHIVG